MAQRLNNINEIIKVLKSGAKFYRKSARQSGDQDKENIYIEHAELRENVASELATIIEDVGGEVAEVSAVEEARSATARLASKLTASEQTLVNQLEEHEDRTLEVFRYAIRHPDNARDEGMLRDYMEVFQQSHDRMKELKLAS